MTTPERQPLQIAVIDNDSGFLQVLTKRLDGLGWQHRVTGGPAAGRRAGAHAPRRAGHRPRGARASRRGTYLEQVVPAAARAGRHRGHRPRVGRPARARAAAGRRRLDDQAVPPRGADRPRRGRRARRRRPPRRDGRARRSPPASSRSAPDQFQAFVARRVGRAHAPRVRADPAAGRRPRARCSSARTSTSACGATRWRTATAPSTCSCASCAQKLERASPDWRYIHTHFGVGYRFAAPPADGGAPSDPMPRRSGEAPAASPLLLSCPSRLERAPARR